MVNHIAVLVYYDQNDMCKVIKKMYILSESRNYSITTYFFFVHNVGPLAFLSCDVPAVDGPPKSYLAFNRSLIRRPLINFFQLP